MQNPAQGESSSSIIKPADGINGNGFSNREHDHDEHCAAQKSSSQFNSVLRHRNQFRSDEVIQNRATNEQKDVCDKPELIFRLRFNRFLAWFRATRLRQGLPNFWFGGNFLRCLDYCHLFKFAPRGAFDCCVRQELGPPCWASEEPEQRFLRCLDPTSQYFRNAPGLGDAAAGEMRFACVEHFTDGADAVVAEMLREGLQKFSGVGLAVGVYF